MTLLTPEQIELTLSAAIGCLAKAEAVIADEFEYDAESNEFGKERPEWVAELSHLIHAAKNHAINANMQD